MTKRLEEAIEKVRQLPSERRDQAADILLSLVDQEPEALQLSPQQLSEVERRLLGPAETVAHEKVRDYFKKPPI